MSESKRSIYIIRLRMSSPEWIESTKKIDERNVQTTYHFIESVRREILKIRGKYRYRVYNPRSVLDFYGLYITDGDELPAIKQEVEAADKELKKIDQRLYASIQLIPLDMKAIKGGELYREILDAIHYQIINRVLKRIIKMPVGILNPRTKKALENMLDEMQALNLFNDEEIDVKIKEIKQRLNYNIEVLRDDLIREIETYRTRASMMEIF